MSPSVSDSPGLSSIKRHFATCEVKFDKDLQILYKQQQTKHMQTLPLPYSSLFCL